MKVCVVGAGSIGGLLAARLARAGEEVTVIARGAHLAAIRSDGLTLLEEDGRALNAPVAATDDIRAAGRHDLVVLGMKAHQVAEVAPALDALCHERTSILTAQNGIPWWYFLKGVNGHAGQGLESVDPGGVVAAHVAVERVLGSVVYPAAEISAPGTIRLIEGNRFSLGELDGAETDRVRAVSEALTRAGFKAPVVADIRSEIWMKLWGNLSLNPISALTHATLEDICRFPDSRALVAEMMAEARAVGEALGIRFRISIDKRIAGAEAVGRHKTSMLQDVEAGRAVEIDALVGSVLELGRITGVPTPQIGAVHGLVKLLAKVLADEGGRLAVTRREG